MTHNRKDFGNHQRVSRANQPTRSRCLASPPKTHHPKPFLRNSTPPTPPRNIPRKPQMASGTSNFQRGGLPYRGAPSQQVGRGGARSGGGALGHSQAPQQQIQQQQLPAQQPQQQRGASGAAQMGQGQAAEITDEQREEIDGAVSWPQIHRLECSPARKRATRNRPRED